MKLLRRILVTIAVTLAAIFVIVNWIAPVALSFYMARKAPPVARVVPTDLPDQSISPASGAKLSYLGYEFEVPWNDLDEKQTKFYPKDKPEKNRCDLHFRSGLRLLVTIISAREWARNLPSEFNVSPQVMDSFFGHDTMKSDYGFVKALYEYTPDKVNHWAAIHGLHSREDFFLMIKPVALSKEAETGIFRIHTQGYAGFQQGSPSARPDALIFNLYSDRNSVEMIFLQKNYTNPSGVTQAEINRIVQTLQEITPAAKIPRIAETSVPQISAR